MLENRKRSRRAVTILALVALAMVFGHDGSPSVGAAEPGPTPGFSNPARIDHPLFPVVPGAVKVYLGREDGKKITLVETHLTETREFDWGGGSVSCRPVRTLAFVSGVLVGTKHDYFAQADNGAVYRFGWTESGEDSDGEEEDGDEEEPGGWVVGQRASSDPVDTVIGASPALYLPAAPATGDLWLRVDVPPFFVETSEVTGLRTVRALTGRYKGCLTVRSTNAADGDSETRWYAPGAGLVKAVGHRERLRLQASTIR